MYRILFLNKKDCSDFFSEVRNKLNIQNWKKVGEFIGTNKSMIDNYKQRKICLPENRFEKMLNLLDENRKKYFLELIEKRDNNWGQVIGGKNAYSINKKEFDKGRKKAARIRKKQVKYNFDINMPLSNELCEFIGVFIGDGFTNKYGNLYHVEITGDRNLDLDYYNNQLKLICQKLFNINPHIYERKGYVRFILYSKRLFEMLTKRFSIPTGVKCYKIVIPEEILKAEKKFLNSTLKGMFNTDGGIGFDRRKSYKKPYIRVNYTSASEKLIKQLHEILLKYSIKHSIHKKKNMNNEKVVYMIQINGTENVKKFILKIGFSNNRHLNKIKNFL